MQKIVQSSERYHCFENLIPLLVASLTDEEVELEEDEWTGNGRESVVEGDVDVEVDDEVEEEEADDGWQSSGAFGFMRRS